MKLHKDTEYSKYGVVSDHQDINKGLRYHILDRDAEIIEYEQLLHKEFSHHNLRSWVTRHYLAIDNNRYRSPIPYSCQFIYGVYEDSRLISAIAINFNTEGKMQLEEVGFSLKKDFMEWKYCEALNFFIDRHKHHHSFEILRNLRIFLSDDLKAKNLAA